MDRRRDDRKQGHSVLEPRLNAGCSALWEIKDHVELRDVERRLDDFFAENLHCSFFAENLYGSFFAENLHGSFFAESLNGSFLQKIRRW